MKRKTFISLALLFFLLTLTACSSKTQNPAPSGVQNDPNQPGSGRLRRPDFGQPERAVDIRGVVKSILGNEVTVIKIDMPDRQASSTTEKTLGSNASGSKDAALSLTGANSSVRMGQGRMGGMAGGPGGPDDQTNTREQMLARFKEMSTGEETIIVPVGIKMMKSDNTNGKREMVEATLADITTDKMITIWLNAGVTDKKVAEFVLIN